MLYANSGEMCCFECASVGHVRLSCPHGDKRDVTGQSNDTNGSMEKTETERVETENQNVHNEKDSGKVSTESETTEAFKVGDNVNGETRVVVEMVMTETEKNTEQVEKLETC